MIISDEMSVRKLVMVITQTLRGRGGVWLGRGSVLLIGMSSLNQDVPDTLTAD